jgi:hypothetical protein
MFNNAVPCGVGDGLAYASNVADSTEGGFVHALIVSGCVRSTCCVC